MKTQDASAWPLVVFTLLAQAAVGAFLAAGFVRLVLARALPEPVAGLVLAAPLGVTGVLVVLAGLSSTGHLARPLLAWRAVRHARSSWLSVEIVMFAGFAALVVPLAIAGWRGGPPGVARDALAALAACLGGGLLYSMGQVYRLPSRPAWDHPITPVSFFLTAALLGVLIVAAAVALHGAAVVGGPDQFPERLLALDRTVRLLVLAGGVLLVVEVLAIQVQLAVRREGSRAAALPEPRRALRRAQRVSTVRTLLVMAAAALAGWFLLRRPPLSGVEPLGALLIWGALNLAAIESLVGRIQFYQDRPVAGV